ncbi:hypothetical protein CPS_3903 [Colwellia psychrerythraea 34H]|uniref:Uncharacterized protein n=1 Tax=Colwellia psychrerythraea (strain 34H / ATCC BAA-681) TaxID=167879 RepID=Q47XA6_COLP3|nr:hypothetical protein CPS_3903 [Colwellia psychrerythraea 34H]
MLKSDTEVICIKTDIDRKVRKTSRTYVLLENKKTIFIAH